MKAIERIASFDENGKIITENLPALKNKKVKLLILIEEEENDLYDLSASGLTNAYSQTEPDYNLSMVQEPNLLYKND